MFWKGGIQGVVLNNYLKPQKSHFSQAKAGARVPRVPFFKFTILHQKKHPTTPLAILKDMTSSPPYNKIMVCDLLYLFFLQSIKKNQKILVPMRSAFGISLRLLRSRVQ
jgi:hypothetical protein